MKLNSMNNTNSIDEYATLKKLNDEEVVRQIPLIVYLAILCISGTAGNSLICYIFAKKCKLSTYYNLVTFLAIINLFTCCIVIPLELIAQFWQYTFDNIWLCKINSFLCAFTAFTSGSLLFCIAFDRYRKVCTPLRWQVSDRTARYACIASAAVGIATAWTTPVIYGIEKWRHSVHNVTISRCEITDNFKDTSFMHFINIMLTIFFSVSFLGISSFYGSIAWRLKKQMNWKYEKQAGVEIRGKKLEMTPVSNKPFAEQSEEAQGLESDTTLSIGLLDSISANKGRVVEPAILEMEQSEHHNNETVVEQSEETEEPKSDTDVNTDALNSVSANKGRVAELETLEIEKDEHNNNKIPSSNFDLRKERPRKNRMTLIMFMVSLAYIVSFVPIIILFLIKSLDKTFLTSLNDSYFINNAINPVIYGIFDTWFRKSCKKLCTCRHGI
ncbi:D(2) dopamine receptor-like [Mercenaria mercenaria]|uniref:D(2) dopamine receptor-like n=1 Tax=Mercenaria mercenaria TaxID=6596 RepID=UPI00234E535B|nr:D(2) dopamine receptor-like [Mercenaria mercenaria]